MILNKKTPDVYIEEESSGARPIEPVGTSTAGFIGKAPVSNPDFFKKAERVNNWTEFCNKFAPASDNGQKPAGTPLSSAVYGFFENGGSVCYVVDIGDGPVVDGTNALETQDNIAIVAAPGYTDFPAYNALLSHCAGLGDRVAILDGPGPDAQKVDDLVTVMVDKPSGGVSGLRAPKSDKGFGSFYYPWIRIYDPLPPNDKVDVPPSGHIAGIWARTDATRGVHKAPANEIIRGAVGLTHYLAHSEIGELNESGVNSLRYLSREGIVVWGARTLADQAGDWRYLNVRRLFCMIEESIVTSTRWIVFEPNDYTLWKSIRRDITAFLTLLWRGGALMGRTPEEAFFVKCDEETNPQASIDLGYVVTIIGIAPVKPAEFVVFRIRQHQSGPEVE
jgi:uncharacterized protein